MDIPSKFLIVGLGLLAACSSNAPGVGGTDPGAASTPMSDAYATLASDFITAVGDSNGLTPAGDLPNNTGVSYTGVAKLQDASASPDTYLGDLSLSVNFAGDQKVSGSIDISSVILNGATSETASTGNLTITGDVTGTNSLTDPAITGSADGTVDATTGVSLEMTGVFAGTAGQNVSTTFVGTDFVGSGYASTSTP